MPLMYTQRASGVILVSKVGLGPYERAAGTSRVNIRWGQYSTHCEDTRRPAELLSVISFGLFLFSLCNGGDVYTLKDH